MAWTAPMTAVGGQAWTAAQWNTHVRDNLLETMPGKATAAGRWFVASGANAIAERVITHARVETSEGTASTSYTALATAGPAVTVTTGTQALVFTSASVSCSVANNRSSFSYKISGGSIASSDTWAGILDGVTASDVNRFGQFNYHTGLTAGSNTFTMEYKTSAGTATFARREIIVMGM